MQKATRWLSLAAAVGVAAAWMSALSCLPPSPPEPTPTPASVTPTLAPTTSAPTTTAPPTATTTATETAPPTASPTAVPPAATDTPTIPPVTVTPSPTPDPTIPCPNGISTDCSTWGSGKESYCRIYKAWVAKYGCAPTGKVWWWTDDTMGHLVMAVRERQTRGIGATMANPKFGCDPSKWKKEPQSIPIFGPYTGAQHEWGGNDHLAAAAILAGFTPDDMTYWLLWGEYRHNRHWNCHGVVIK